MLLPAPKPANRLYPAAPSTRWPPRLYCVSELMALTTRLPGTLTVSMSLPRTTVLFDLTTEPAPTAVAWSRLLLPTLAKLPMSVLFVPVLLPALPAPTPKNELKSPVVLLLPASLPKNALKSPVVLVCPAHMPKNEL